MSFTLMRVAMPIFSSTGFITVLFRVCLRIGRPALFRKTSPSPSPFHVRFLCSHNASKTDVAFDACRKQPTRANSLSLVRFDDNDYSVPVRYAHHEILIKGYVERVVLCHKDKVVAKHHRSWGKGGVFFDYRHYLPLLEHKLGALDYVLPLAELNLPECFETLRRRLLAEEHKEGEGPREFIRVLRLLEDYPIGRVREAVEKALLTRAHSRDAVMQFLLPRFSWEHTTFLLDGREHLRLVKVAKPDLSLYATLLSEGGAS